MKQWIAIVSLVLLAASAPRETQAQARPTPDYWQCFNRIGGSWEWGQAPAACDADSFGDDSVVRRLYPTLIFEGAAAETKETPRYMTSLHAVIRDGAEYYLKARKPGVTSSEIESWRRAIFALAHQESFWTHYRLGPDRRLKMMRGDQGHGHGMMQIDDRWHFVEIQDGKGWDLIDNLGYAMEEYYAQWQRAASASCVGSATDFVKRARSAYSAYNGGASKLCRWTNPNDAWARNDAGFYAKFQNREWERSVTSRAGKAPFDVGCRLQKGSACEGTKPPASLDGRLVKLASGAVCLVNGTAMDCVRDARDTACLQAIGGEPGETPVTGIDARVRTYKADYHDRHALCANLGSSHYRVGAVVRAETNINIRATAGGGQLGLLPKGEAAQVLDFEIRNTRDLDRYYKVKYKNVTGYVFGGDAQSFHQWLSQGSAGQLRETLIARAGSVVRVANTDGVNLRATPGGTRIKTLAAGTLMNVLGLTVRGGDNQIFYKAVRQGSGNKDIGYIYAGRLLPDSTLALWTRMVTP